MLSLAVRDAYTRWAETYPPVPHNPLMHAEQRVMLALWPAFRPPLALDLACGSGRYSRLLRSLGAEHVVAVDFCPEMLAQVEETRETSRVLASMDKLPFADASFPLIVCGLAIGHVTDIASWITEMARIMAPGASLLLSDFHAEAARCGLTRSFKDAQGVTHTVPHVLHEIVDIEAAVRAAGLQIVAQRSVRIGIDFVEEFRGHEEFCTRWHGLPLVYAMRLRK
jgi:SAM-dependent methyltransferase